MDYIQKGIDKRLGVLNDIEALVERSRFGRGAYARMDVFLKRQFPFRWQEDLAGHCHFKGGH